MMKEYVIHMDEKLFKIICKLSNSLEMDISDFISLCCSFTLLDKKFEKYIDKS